MKFSQRRETSCSRLYSPIRERSDVIKAVLCQASGLRYLEHLKAQGTRRGTLRITARVLYRATLHMGLRESGPIQLKAIAKASEQWAFRNAPPERWRGPGGAGPQKLYYRTISRWLRFLGRLEEPAPKPSPHRAEVEAFMTYMQEERGLAPETLKTRRWHLGRFFAQCEGIALRRLSLSDVERFLISLGKKGWTRVAIRSMCSSLRSFFLYAESRHWTRPGVGAGIRKPRLYREEYLPQGPSWSHVENVKGGVNVWSAAFLQAKVEVGRLVCANVFGLCWSVVGSGP